MPSTASHPTSLPLPPTSTLPNRTRSHLSTTSGQPTPSLLTPHTRSEAEAAFTANSLYQTDAAAPTSLKEGGSLTGPDVPGEEELEARRQSLGLGVRPPVPTRSSTNYFNALTVAMKSKKGSTTETEKGDEGVDVSAEDHLKGGPVGGVQNQPVVDGAVAEWQPKIDRQMSFNEQDRRRLMQQKLMEKTAEGDMGYDSAA